MKKTIHLSFPRTTYAPVIYEISIDCAYICTFNWSNGMNELTSRFEVVLQMGLQTNQYTLQKKQSSLTTSFILRGYKLTLLIG